MRELSFLDVLFFEITILSLGMCAIVEHTNKRKEK